MLKTIRLALWGLAGVAAVLAIGLFYFTPAEPPRSDLAPGRAVADTAEWSLVDHTGKPFGPADLKGKPTLIVFGFTHCPDVCPTALAYVADVLRTLGTDAAAVRPVFLTVDPERDTQAVMAEYVALFDERIIGLTGAPDEVAKAAKSFGAYFRRVPRDGGDYTMDHTASMVLADAQGRLRSTLDIHEAPGVAVEKVRRLLRSINVPGS